MAAFMRARPPLRGRASAVPRAARAQTVAERRKPPESDGGGRCGGRGTPPSLDLAFCPDSTPFARCVETGTGGALPLSQKGASLMRLALLLLAMSFAARAEDRRLAVLEMRGKGLDAQALGLLSESARAGALQAVRGKGVSVVTRENLLLLLKSAGVAPEDCEGECEVETGRRIGADFVVTGDAVHLEDR